MSNLSNISLPIALPIYGDVEAIEIAPLIESRENCITVKKILFNICIGIGCIVIIMLFFVFLFFI